jgi:hypothetical protein
MVCLGALRPRKQGMSVNIDCKIRWNTGKLKGEVLEREELSGTQDGRTECVKKDTAKTAQVTRPEPGMFVTTPDFLEHQTCLLSTQTLDY